MVEMYTVKGGKLEKVRFVHHIFDENVLVKFRIEKDRSVHEIITSSRKAKMRSRAYKGQFCPHAIETEELDYHMLDKWVADNCCGLWYRGGFDDYHFQQEEDAVLFKLTWGK